MFQNTRRPSTLSGLGLLATTRGRGGGLRLLKPAQSIVLGEVIRQTESDFTLVECVDAAPRGGQPMRFVVGLPRPSDGVVRRPRVPFGGESR